MDSVASCKDKLAYFRLKELKDVLSQLGMAKQGKKQDLVDRISGLLSADQDSSSTAWGRRHTVEKEGVMKIIDDTYRKMQVHGAPDLASRSQSSAVPNLIKPKLEVEEPAPVEKVRCPCGNSHVLESMIKCEDEKCRAWQHMNCVIIPEKAVEGAPLVIPPQYYCEICRVNRADPFWVTTEQPLLPVKWASSNVAADGTNSPHNVERTFTLTRVHRDVLQKSGYSLQAWCILLNDKVPFRMQWPQFADLQFNGFQFRTTNRPGSQLLGINGRDDGPVLTAHLREGTNRISLSASDSRAFCFGVRIGCRRTVAQVLSFVPKEADGECFEDALARVCRSISGGNAGDNGDNSDSDLEVIADSVTVSLKCPMGGSRIKIAGRFKPCAHRGCFDLETFVELNQRSRKWQCPICLKNYSLEQLIIDPYFNRITTLMQSCGEDVVDIEVKPDGSWRAKNENEHSDLFQWHLPDGSICAPSNGDVKRCPAILKQIKQEGTSDGLTGLKLGIRKNRNGFWEVSKHENGVLPSNHYISDDFEVLQPKVLPMSGSTTSSNVDGEDASVNQDGRSRYDVSPENVSFNFETSVFGIGNDLSLREPNDIIVLSDSDDENRDVLGTLAPDVGMVPTGNIFEAVPEEDNGVQFSVPGSNDPVPYGPFPDNEELGGNLGLFSGNIDDFGIPLWHMPSSTQNGAGFRLFGPEADEGTSDPLIDVSSDLLRPTVNGYGLEADLGNGSMLDPSNNVVQEAPVCPLNGDVDELNFDAHDPSLQIFLPSGPLESSYMQDDRQNEAHIPMDVRSDDWISLSLGGCSNLDNNNIASTTSREQIATKNGSTETLSSTGLNPRVRDNKVLGDMDRYEDRLFSPPRQPRSVRRRLHLSIDTDSE